MYTASSNVQLRNLLPHGRCKEKAEKRTMRNGEKNVECNQDFGGELHGLRRRQRLKIFQRRLKTRNGLGQNILLYVNLVTEGQPW